VSVLERAQIYRWFERHIMGDNKKLRYYWLGLLPITHAYTIHISSNLKSDPKYKDPNEEELLNEAWKLQLSAVTSLGDFDEKECLERLEEEMFEVSMRASVAGHFQWGLDVGQHQFWDPYVDLPEKLESRSGRRR